MILTCYMCSVDFRDVAGGSMVRNVIAVTSPKSGATIPKDVPYPDGSLERFVCNDCSRGHTSLALGMDDQGNDFPPAPRSS